MTLRARWAGTTSTDRGLKAASYPQGLGILNRTHPSHTTYPSARGRCAVPQVGGGSRGRWDGVPDELIIGWGVSGGISRVTVNIHFAERNLHIDIRLYISICSFNISRRRIDHSPYHRMKHDANRERYVSSKAALTPSAPPAARLCRVHVALPLAASTLLCGHCHPILTAVAVAILSANAECVRSARPEKSHPWRAQ